MTVEIQESAETRAMRLSAKNLSVYLNEHLRGETLGVELATRASSEHKGTPLGNFLLLLSWALDEDRDSLVRLMRKLGVREKPVGTLGRVAETLGRLRFTRSSPARTLVDLELLDQRINSKLDMWNALRSSVGDRVDDMAFDKLIGRAEGQAEALGQRRIAVAADALSHRDGSSPTRSGTKPAAMLNSATSA